VVEEWIIRVYDWTFTIPEGFECDLSSVPRPLWPLIAPHELSFAAAVLHDWLYCHGGVVPGRKLTRAEVDAIFAILMLWSGVKGIRFVSSYLAVRFFGWFSWQGD
jgi:hypothetical protein